MRRWSLGLDVERAKLWPASGELSHGLFMVGKKKKLEEARSVA